MDLPAMRCHLGSVGGWPALALSWALLATGCGDQDAPYQFEVHPVSGTVKHQGKPLGGAIVRFHPKDPALVTVPEGREGPPVMLTTTTNPDGTFTMSTYLADDGIPAGDYNVTVVIGPEGESSVENGDGPLRTPTRSVPGKRYRDPATSPLTARVKPGEVNRFAFEVN
jgi:hypothetical protein